jgi:putative nucleotidyltransferase with HDIG domain
MTRSTTIAAGLKKVPPFPPVAAKLLSLLSSPEVEINEVAELIGSDPTFTARLLQRVNSIQFGLAFPVTSVPQAVALLGLDMTREVTLWHAMAAYTKGALGTEELRRCWQHTVATAVLAEAIAQACGAFTNVAYTAGLMHDIGRLGLLVAYPKEYERVIRDAAERCLDLLDFEHEEFGLDHTEAGRLLAERWDLPAEIGVIAGRHHDPCEGSELDLLRIVHVACRLAVAFGYDVAKPLGEMDIDAVLADLPPSARERLSNARTKLCERIEERILECGSEKESVPPEESLALLAAATTQTPSQDIDRPAVLEPKNSEDFPIPDTPWPSFTMEEELPRSRTKAVIVMSALVGLGGVAVLVLWLLH